MLPVFGRGFRQHALNVCAARGAFYAGISFGAGTVSASGGIEMNEFINVKSEIGRLRRVMLHRPGIELQNLMPDYLERMLAEDTPDVRRAGEEHDVFAGILRTNSVDVVYIEDMFKEVVKDDAVRKAFIKDFVELGSRNILNPYLTISFSMQLRKVSQELISAEWRINPFSIILRRIIPS